MTRPPVFLYNDPHEVHGELANALDAKWVPAEQGGIVDRFKAARGFDRPLLLEGGVPLVQNAFGKLLRKHKKPSVLLAADETQQNIYERLPYYSTPERWAHRLAHRYVDGALAVSTDIEGWCRRLISGPVKLAHPFILQQKYDRFAALEPSLKANRLVCIGEFRPANNQKELARAVESLGGQWRAVFIGSGTSDLNGYDYCTGLGYVEFDELLEYVGRSSLVVHPGIAGAFPVSLLEGMAAGLPAMTTHRVGSHFYVAVNMKSWLTRLPNQDSLAGGLQRYAELSVEEREDLSESARFLGSKFQEAEQLPKMVDAYNEVVNEL